MRGGDEEKRKAGHRKENRGRGGDKERRRQGAKEKMRGVEE